MGREYAYDSLARPVTRRTARQGNTVNDSFACNSRSELTAAVSGRTYGYSYDNIGNRKTAREDAEEATAYTTGPLNQYTAIERGEEAAFEPVYDADGNQTLIRTFTGIWQVAYNAENRPVRFVNESAKTVVECTYDYMGRRFEKKVTVGGTTGFHARYLYRDYLQVAECDLTGETPVLVRSYLWDPSEPEATRVLAMTRWEANGTQVKEHLYCMHDAMKNVTSLFGEARGRRALYEYRPYGGLVTSEGNMAQENKFRFSCEYMDDELGLIYYNYRHLNPRDGRWISRDPIMEQGGWNLFAFVGNKIFNQADILGLICTIEYSIKLHTILIRKVDKDGNILRLTTSRVFSGNGDGKNNPDNVGNKDNGPIPPGKYYVIKRQSGGIRSRIEDWTYKLWNDNDKTQWLAFIAIDDALDDQKEINGVFRSSFRMHYGTRSLGCITFLDKEVFEKAREFILETESRTVKGADGTEYIYYGILEVKKE